LIYQEHELNNATTCSQEHEFSNKSMSWSRTLSEKR
jgi:hypothetical protein